ncbi:MAG: protein kinase, partial [Solirubrobacterales bacterium]|nr:protein kinase [Solirubrobacterales bacterium]
MPSSHAATSQRRIGRYLLQEELGRGGMGVVYAALDEGLGRRVALKLLRPGGPDDDAARGERFEQEMQIAISLEHPNIVPVHETGTEDGVRYIAMRLVDGEDLGAVIRREGALEPGRVARLGRQIASALDAAHARGLVHRDVKPGNVLLTGSGDEEHAYLTDFGLTRDADSGLTQTGQWIGTVDYAAPEQIEAAPLSARTDVYALGCVFYHALTGELPFTGSFAAKATGHVSRPLPSVAPSVPRHGAQLDKVLAVATAKDAQRRHASAGALARSVARVIAADEDAAQRTAAMPVLFPDGDEAPTTVQDTGATLVQPREPRPASAPVAVQQPHAQPRPRARPVPVPIPIPAGASPL